MRVCLDDVWFRYRRKTVLRGVSWQFGTGVTGLLGPNGAGKTTLLSVLVTLASPDSGRVSVGEHDLSTVSGRAGLRADLGFVPQRFGLAGEMRVRETVAYTGWVNGLAEVDCDAAADAALARVGLADEAGQRVRTLSGGQRQRLGLAAALAHNPAVVVLDEPTVGLDPGHRMRMRRQIAEMGTERTVIMSSHLLEDIEQVCHRVGVLAQGRLVFAGAIDELSTLIDEVEQQGDGMGSRFEQAYEALLVRWGQQQHGKDDTAA